jgi:starch synthase
MRDIPALAAAIVGLLRDPHEQKLRGQALRERVVAQFGWPALARRLVDVYRTCLEER